MAFKDKVIEKAEKVEKVIEKVKEVAKEINEIITQEVPEGNAIAPTPKVG